MEFDKSKILTIATAEKIGNGAFGFVGYGYSELLQAIKNNEKSHVRRSRFDDFCFYSKERGLGAFFYPAPEPTYRPFANADEFKPYREKWIVGIHMWFQHDGYSESGINIGQEKFSWKEAFRLYKFEDGTPFGIKEDL